MHTISASLTFQEMHINADERNVLKGMSNRRAQKIRLIRNCRGSGGAESITRPSSN